MPGNQVMSLVLGGYCLGVGLMGLSPNFNTQYKWIYWVNIGVGFANLAFAFLMRAA